MELSEGQTVKKESGLKNFTEPRKVEMPSARKRSGDEPIVGLTLRLSRNAWKDLHEWAFANNASINSFVFDVLNRQRLQENLPPLEPLPAKKKSDGA
jgi:hypothetical protein